MPAKKPPIASRMSPTPTVAVPWPDASLIFCTTLTTK